MFKKAGFSRRIFVTLFTVCSIMVLTTAGAIKMHGPNNHQFLNLKACIPYRHALFNHSAASYFFFNKLPISNDYTKVRYMGGDCGHYPIPFSIDSPGAIFYENKSSIDRKDFIFSGSGLLFKLRGPPADHMG